MGAGYKCPSCKRWSSCDCTNCKSNPTYGPLYSLESDGESIKCPHCGVVDHIDSWSDECYKDLLESEVNENNKSKDKY